jgi:hypothetical protein
MVVVLMDVEKLKKINAMTKEFKKFGFSEDSLGAIKDAGKIYGDKEEQDMINQADNKKNESEPELKITEIQNKEDIIKQVSTDYDPNATQENELNHLRKKLLLLEEFKLEQAEKMIQMSKQLENMQNSFNNINEKLNQALSQNMKTEKKEEQKALHDEFVQQTSSTEEKKESTEKKGEYNQRVGNFKSDDVAIEKMFYYGNK